MTSKHKPKLIVIVGPTASGKSELAVEIAKRIKGEVISADSRQIYRGLDIGTDKVRGKWQVINGQRKFLYKNIPHYCIDFVSPKKTFTVAEYKKCAEAAIKNIARRGKTPVIVGGTGFWINTVVFDLNLPAVPPNQKLRRLLGKKKTSELLKILQKLDPERAKTIEQKNPRRLIRALEIIKSLGKVPTLKNRSPYQTLWIGISPQQKILKKKIIKRAQNILQQGLIKETKNLLKMGVTKKQIREFGFEYKEALKYVENKLGRRPLQEKINKDTLEYARRQILWFKKNRAIHWVKKPLASLSVVKKFISPLHRSRKTA